MTKVYLVKYVVEVCEEVEADSEAEALQAFSEIWNSPEELLAYGEHTVEDLGEVEYDGQPDEMQEWHDFDPDC